MGCLPRNTLWLLLTSLGLLFRCHVIHAFEFGDEIAISGQLQAPGFLCHADLDGDGDADLLCTSGLDNKVLWYPFEDGDYASPCVVSSQIAYPTSAVAVDVDQDGDLDLLATAAGSGELVFCEALGGGSFLAPRPLLQGLGWPRALLCEDLDGDEHLDVALTCADDDQVLWCSLRQDTLLCNTPIVIDDNLYSAWSLAAGDIDNDGDLDLLAGGMLDDCVRWYRNEDGAGCYSLAQQLTNEAHGLRSVALADLDGDSDLDALYASAWDGSVAWFRNADFAGHFGVCHILSAQLQGASIVKPVDLDADNDLDLLVAVADTGAVVALVNTNGQATFAAPRVLMNDIVGVRAIANYDWNSDGLPDFAAVSEETGRLQWTTALGNLTYDTPLRIDTNLLEPRRVLAADLDGDTDVDLLASFAGEGALAWFENDGAGAFSTAQIIATQLDSALAIDVFDVDGDQYPDVIVGAAGAGRVNWYRNTEGHGAFSTAICLCDTAPGVCFLDHADIDGDGYQELALACYADSSVRIVDNEAGTFASVVYHLVGIPKVSCVRFDDLDQDGDQDLAVGRHGSYTCCVFNEEGLGGFSELTQIASTHCSTTSIALCDINGDGISDLLRVTDYAGAVLYHAGSGEGQFGPETLLDRFAFDHHGICLLDADSDGDLDLITPSYHEDYSFQQGGGLDYFEYLGPAEFAEPQRLQACLHAPTCVVSADFNGDGLPDIAACSRGDSKVVVYPGLAESELPHASTKPQALGLRAFPNPFNPVTRIELELAAGGPSCIRLHDLLGRRVMHVHQGYLRAGRHEFLLDGSELSSGLYFVAARVGDTQQVLRVSLLK